MGKRALLIGLHRRAGATIVLMLLASLGLLVAGVLLPFTSVTKLWLFENQISVYEGLVVLLEEGELFLFLILLIFTICFPIVKINALLALWLYPGMTSDRARTIYRFVSNMGKWSMLDVFVVAVLVLTVKSGGVASITVEGGFFMFFVSVMLTQFSSIWTGRISSRLQK